MKFEKLERPQIAYAVRHTDCIITIQVVHRFTEHTYHGFLVGKAVWVDENHSQHPREGEWLPLTVDPSTRGNPFEHPIVGWTLEEAADILRDKFLKDAQYYRDQAKRFLTKSREIETRDYRKLICGDSEEYVSPFTGEKR